MNNEMPDGKARDCFRHTAKLIACSAEVLEIETNLDCAKKAVALLEDLVLGLRKDLSRMEKEKKQ